MPHAAQRFGETLEKTGVSKDLLHTLHFRSSYSKASLGLLPLRNFSLTFSSGERRFTSGDPLTLSRASDVSFALLLASVKSK